MGKDDRIFFLSQLFRPKGFDMDFPQAVFNGVFELPLLRNAQKRHNKISKNKKKHLPHLVPISQIYVAFKLFSLAPLGFYAFLSKGISKHPTKKGKKNVENVSQKRKLRGEIN
jgi:hypothetical protein